MSLLDRARRPLATADAGVNRLYGWKYNPLYHSGVLAATLLAVVMVTGLYLIFFWGVSAPYASVERITTRVFLGAFARSMHRYASDAAIVAVLIHALRMWLQRRTWGPRALAWLSGFVLLGTIWVLGWTGYVMVWDIQGEVLAREGARWLDALPLFSEPISRAFDGERALPGAFFFLNLFAHVALPVALGLVFWLHVARVARPRLLPPRRLLWGVIGLLAAASVLVPVRMAPPADAFRLPVAAPYDFFYAFFLPLTQPLKPWLVWVLGGSGVAALALVPAWMKPRGAALPPPSTVDERSCTGCEQCWLDCPYEAIRMVDRTDGRPYQVAQVDPGLCTSCGICAGSCAPMGIGPAGRTGKDQLALARAFAKAHPLTGGIVIIACRQAGGLAAGTELGGAPIFAVSCSGNLHTSVVEFLVRSGAGGVLVVACPPRDCWNREGPVWLEQRLYHDREAELLPRVDKRRVRLVHAGAGERSLVGAALRSFRGEVRALEAAAREAEPDLTRECDAVAESGAPAASGGEASR
jgi:ferredoxin